MALYSHVYCRMCNEHIGVACSSCGKKSIGRMICINDPNSPSAFRYDSFGFKCEICGMVTTFSVDSICECGYTYGICWVAVSD